MNWATVVAWLKSKNLTTHVVVGFLFSFAVAYTSSDALRQQIATVFIGYPIVVTKLGIICGDIVILASIWAKISHSSSPAGTVANAEVIMSLPSAPTSAAIEAAKTTTK